MLELNSINCGNCVDLLKELPDNYIDCCVSSPPYKEKDGWSYGLMIDSFLQLYRVLKPNSLFYLNFGHLKEDKFRPFQTCLAALGSNFKLNDTIIWVKNHFTPLQGNNLNNLTEFIFMLYKCEVPKLDRLSIGIPYVDKTNAKRWKGAEGKDLRCGGNCWHIDYETIQNKDQKLHKDRFPLELPTRCLKLANLQKDAIVIDIFNGSGTTCLAAKNLGFNYIGIDKDENNCSIARQRLQNL